MKRSLFLQILVRAAVACALLCAALWLAQNLWVGVIAGLVVSFLLASSVVRLCREDETALDDGVGEGELANADARPNVAAARATIKKPASTRRPFLLETPS